MNKYLNAREHQILCIILNSGAPLTVAEIISAHPELTANIIQPAIRKLLRLKLIEVADIVMNRNIFSRSFQAAPGATEIIQKMFMDEYLQFKKMISSESLRSAMMQADSSPEEADREIARLDDMLKEFRDKNR